MSAEKDEQNRALERLLTDVFDTEADRVSPDPDALASIRARVADGDSDAAQRRVSDEAVADSEGVGDGRIPSTRPSGSGGWLLAAAAIVVALIAVGVVVKSVAGGHSGSTSAGGPAAGATRSQEAAAPAPTTATTNGPMSAQRAEQPATISVPVTSYTAGTPRITVHATPGTRIAWSIQAQNTTQVAAGSLLTGSSGTNRGIGVISTSLPAGAYQLVLTPTGGTPTTVALSVN